MKFSGLLNLLSGIAGLTHGTRQMMVSDWKEKTPKKRHIYSNVPSVLTRMRLERNAVRHSCKVSAYRNKGI